MYVKHDGVPVADCLSQNVQAESALEDETINVTVIAISLVSGRQDQSDQA